MVVETMINDSIIGIQQSLHGYKEGHKLLSSSVDLPDEDKRYMLSMSDYSGSGKEKGFLTYLTGYPLPNSKFYVLAKTWYATEMERPGCVWTHSLLIDFTDLLQIDKMQRLLFLFRRPETTERPKGYSSQLELDQEFVEPTTNDPISTEKFFTISCQLYDNAAKGLIFLSNNSTQFEDTILQVWNWQWPKMKRNFLFSTGSLSVRQTANQIFDLQVFPQARARELRRIENDYLIVSDEPFECASNWLSSYKDTNLSELQQFMIRYGSDFPGDRSSFLPLFEAYLNIKSGMIPTIETIRKAFYDSLPTTQGKILKSEIIRQFLNGQDNSPFDLFKMFLDRPLPDLNLNYSELILVSWKQNRLSSEQLVELLTSLYQSSKNEDLIQILLEIQPCYWTEILFSHEVYERLIALQPNYQGEKTFWRRNSVVQRKWLESIASSETPDWFAVVNAMLEIKADDMAATVFEKSPETVMTALIVWLNENSETLPTKWHLLIRSHIDYFFIALSRINALSENIIDFTLETLTPSDKFWGATPSDRILQFIQNFESSNIDQIRLSGCYTLLLTCCYDDRLEDPIKINKAIFQPLHDLLANNRLHYSTWQRFKYTIGKELYSIVEQNFLSKLFFDKNRIPEWDHCEFLRRALLVTFLKNQWPPMNIIEAVKDKATFSRLVDFGVQINEGYWLFQLLANEIGYSEDLPSFYYSVLKKKL